MVVCHHIAVVAIACSTLIAVDRPPAESLPVLRDLGFDRVELAFFEGWTAVGPTALAGHAPLLEAELQRLDLAMVALNVGVEGLPRAAARRAIADCLALAVALEAPVVTVQAEPAGEPFSVIARELATLVRMADRAGVKLGVETHIGYVTEHADAAKQLLAEVPGLGLTLDQSHYTFQGEDLDTSLIGVADHVHYRDAARGDLQVKPGAGALEPASFMQLLRSSGYASEVTVEYIDAPEDAAAALELLEPSRTRA
jgi:sugar phosphate isomerase/epimerase